MSWLREGNSTVDFPQTGVDTSLNVTLQGCIEIRGIEASELLIEGVPFWTTLVILDWRFLGINHFN